MTRRLSKPKTRRTGRKSRLLKSPFVKGHCLGFVEGQKQEVGLNKHDVSKGEYAY